MNEPQFRPKREIGPGHRPSTWLRYALGRGSIATAILVVIVYSTKDFPRRPRREPPPTGCPHCWAFFNDVLISCVNVRNWLFGVGRTYTYPERTWSQSFWAGSNVSEFFHVVGTCGMYVSLIMLFIVALNVVKKDQMRCFLLAVTPPFLGALFASQSYDNEHLGYGDGTDRECVVQDAKAYSKSLAVPCTYDDPCNVHAVRMEEMSSTIEHLSQINNQREKYIAKLSLKNDFLAEALARVYKYNRKIQNQIRNMPPTDSSSSCVGNTDER